MSILPRLGQLSYDFDEAQKEIQRTSQSLVSLQSQQLSKQILQKLDNARTQSNEERIDQRNDIPFIVKTINDTIQNDEDRKRLLHQTQILSDALEDNSNSLKKYTKEFTHSLMNKGIGKNGEFTPLQNALTRAKDSVVGDLMPIFRVPLEGLGNFFKKRSDRNDRVRDELLKGGGGGDSPQNNPSIVPASPETDITPIHSSNIGGDNDNVFNGQQITNVFNGNTTNIFNNNFSNVTPRANAYPSAGFIESKEEPKFIDTTLVDNDNEAKDFNTLEDEENYRRDSLNEQRKHTEAIEKLSAILIGDKNKADRKETSISGGGSSLLDMGKDYLLTKLGINKAKKIFGGLTSKAGDLFKNKLDKIPGTKKLGGLLAGLGIGGVAVSSGGDNNPVTDAVDMAMDAADTSKPKPNPNNAKPKTSLNQKLKNAFKFLKDSKGGKLGSKSASVVKEQAPRFGRFLVDKGANFARSGATWVAANPVLATYVGLAVGGALSTQYANEKAKETEEGQKLLEYGDGVLDTSDNFDFEEAGFDYVNIEEKGLDAFGKVKDEEKYFESVQEKSKEAWNEANKDTENFRNIASKYKDQKIAWEVWNRGGYEKKYNRIGNDETRLKELKDSFAKDYSDAKYLDSAGLYFNRDTLAQNIMNAGGKLEYHDETNPQLIPSVSVTKDKNGNVISRGEYAENKFLNQNLRVTENKDGSKKLSVYHNTGTTYSEKFASEEGKWSNKTTYEDAAADFTNFTDISELKDAAPMQIKELETEKVGFHRNVLSGFMEDVKDYNSHIGWNTYAPYMFQVESAYLEKDEGLKNTLLDKIKKNFLKTYDKKYKEYEEGMKTKEPVVSKSSIPVLSETERITDIDHDYSKGSFEDVSVTKENNVSAISPKRMNREEITQNNANVSKTEAITQQSNSSKNIEAYTSQPTRTAVVTQEQQSSSTKKKEEQAPTVINNTYNTTNNNVTQPAPQQKPPQLIINPAPSYLGQPTAR